jgi:hypothetical protein
MSNISINNIDTGNVILADAKFNDGVFTAGSTSVVLSGTILARNTTTNKFIPYVKGGTTDGNGVPLAVLTYDITPAAAGDVAIRPMLSGSVVLERLVIFADGDGSNVGAVETDGLRDYSIVPINVTQLSGYDNQ